MITVRPESPGDARAARRVHVAAFPTVGEADLVERLRSAGRTCVALVAEVEGRVVGHIVFSPVTIEGNSTATGGVGLAPLAVLPDFQRRGIGSRLMQEGLKACRRAGYRFVVVLGEPEYYGRFGFMPAARHGLRSQFGAGDFFMVIALQPGCLPSDGELVKYAPEFDVFL